MAKLNQAMSDLLRYNAGIQDRKRSSFNKSHSHTTTFDSGYIIPFMWDRVLPGDEKKIKYSGLARMATPIHPVMDTAHFDVWAFYIPDRLWYADAKKFYGENLDADFNEDGEYIMPYLKPSQYYTRDTRNNVNGVGSLNDYFGFPVCGADQGFEGLDDNPAEYVTAGLHRCYQLIWNEWFRNSSIQPALQLNDGPVVTDDEWNVIKVLRKANKLPDYFTTLLKEPQAGNDVTLPLGEWAPVVTRYDRVYDTNNMPYASLVLVDNLGDTPVTGGTVEIANDGTLFADDVTMGLSSQGPFSPANLWTDLTSATSATINNLRSAITIQQYLELSNRAGKRYQQILNAFWGVLTPDATLQRPELLGSTGHTPVGMRQVLQTSSTDETSPLGTTGAFSITNINNEWLVNKSFTEPGFLLILGCVRPVVSYSQGIDPLLSKLSLYEHYNPIFDNIGNQPVKNRAIFARPGYHNDDVFGYAEAWTEYRIKNNRVSGLMRPDVDGTLSSWNYSLDFEGTPYLDSAFIEVDPSLIDRTIAVPSEPQFICDSYFDYIDIKSMGVHSIPGLTRL